MSNALKRAPWRAASANACARDGAATRRGRALPCRIRLDAAADDENDADNDPENDTALAHAGIRPDVRRLQEAAGDGAATSREVIAL